MGHSIEVSSGFEMGHRARACLRSRQLTCPPKSKMSTQVSSAVMITTRTLGPVFQGSWKPLAEAPALPAAGETARG